MTATAILRQAGNRLSKGSLVLLWMVLPLSSAFSAEPAVSLLIKQGKLPQAEQALKKTLTQNPKDVSALTLLGDVRLKQRKFPQADALYRQAAEGNPESPVAYERLGSLYADEQRIDEAISAYEMVLKLNPQSTKAKTRLATLYEQNGDPQKSLALAQSIAAAVRPSQLLPVITADYFALKQPDEAQKMIGEILRRASTNPELVPQLAAIFLRHGMAGDAGELLRIAEGHQKMTASFLTAQARVQSLAGHGDQATETITKALALDPNHAEALFESARQNGTAGNWAAAIRSLKKMQEVATPRIDALQSLVFSALQTNDLLIAHDAALDLYELTPTRRESAMALAVVLVQAAHWGEAKPFLEKILAADPSDKKAQLAMGIVQYNLGSIDAAAQLLTASLGQGASDAEAHYMLGLVAKQRADFPTAATEMETALATTPDKPEALSALGQVYLQLDQPEKARAILEKAIAKIPDDSQNHYQLGLAYRKLGMADQAREQMQIFQKLSVRKVPQPTGEAATSPK